MWVLKEGEKEVKTCSLCSYVFFVKKNKIKVASYYLIGVSLWQIKLKIMKHIIRLIKDYKIKKGITPVKVVKLSSGITTYIYSNGIIDVKYETV